MALLFSYIKYWPCKSLKCQSMNGFMVSMTSPNISIVIVTISMTANHTLP